MMDANTQTCELWRHLSGAAMIICLRHPNILTCWLYRYTTRRFSDAVAAL